MRLDPELLDYLSEQNEKNRKALREEADANRETFYKTLKCLSWVSGTFFAAVAALLTVGGYFGWKSISGIENTYKQAADNAVTRQINKNNIDHVINDQVKDAVHSMKTSNDIRDSIDKEIHNGNMVQQVAKKIQPGVTAQITPDVISKIKSSAEFKKSVQDLVSSTQSKILDSTYVTQGDSAKFMITGDQVTCTFTLASVGGRNPMNLSYFSAGEATSEEDGLLAYDTVFMKLARDISRQVQNSQGSRVEMSLGAPTKFILTSKLTDIELRKLGSSTGHFSLLFVFSFNDKDGSPHSGLLQWVRKGSDLGIAIPPAKMCHQVFHNIPELHFPCYEQE